MAAELPVSRECRSSRRTSDATRVDAEIEEPEIAIGAVIVPESVYRLVLSC